MHNLPGINLAWVTSLLLLDTFRFFTMSSSLSLQSRWGGAGRGNTFIKYSTLNLSCGIALSRRLTR